MGRMKPTNMLHKYVEHGYMNFTLDAGGTRIDNEIYSFQNELDLQ